MQSKKETSRVRVQKWREALRARGGREVRLALEKKAVDKLEKLQRYYGGVDYATVVTLALNVLDRQKTYFKPGGGLREKDQDVEGKD